MSGDPVSGRRGQRGWMGEQDRKEAHDEEERFEVARVRVLHCRCALSGRIQFGRLRAAARRGDAPEKPLNERTGSSEQD